MADNKDIEKDIERFEQLYGMKNFARLRKEVLLDLRDNMDETNKFLKKYSRKSIASAIANPTTESSIKVLREVSQFFYFVSLHYRRVVGLLSTLMTNNHLLRYKGNPYDNDKDEVKQEYLDFAQECNKWKLKNIIPQINTITVLNGVYYGLVYETSATFFIKPLLPEYCKIAVIENGVRRFAFDLDYFNNKTARALIAEYGVEFERAYLAYKGDKDKNIKGDKTLRWFIPKDQICIKFDEEFPYCLPPLMGCFGAIIDLETYEEIKKDSAILDNYKLINMEIPTDNDGVPKLPFEQSKKYYSMTAGVVPEGVGVSMSPFKVSAINLKDSNNTDKDYTKEGTRDLFNNLGISPILFGITDNATSQTLALSIKTNESMMYKLLKQIENYFNWKYYRPKRNLCLCFLDQSIFNKDEVADKYQKSASYGLPTKLFYAAACDLEPIDTIGMPFIEDDVLKCGTEIFARPLISSNTLSNGDVGRPTTDNPSDNTESNPNANDYK